MSPQLLQKLLNQNWFVSTYRRRSGHSGSGLKATKAVLVLHSLENAAIRFLRTISQHIIVLFMIVYCLLCIQHVNDGDETVPILNYPSHLSVMNKGDPINAAAVDHAEESNTYDKLFGDVTFIHAFIASFSVILVTELGDKTFFIAAIMAMKHSRLVVFVGASFALALMTVLSAVFGQLAMFIPRLYTYYIATALFAIFGLKMLLDGYNMSPNDAQEELAKVQSDLEIREDEIEKESTLHPVVEPSPMAMVDDLSVDINTESLPKPAHKTSTKRSVSLISRVILQAFSLTFLAEWGDRSQLTTVILAARENVYGIIVGGVLGHCICTGLAVIGGRMMAERISVRTVTIIGGIVFLMFAFSALLVNPNEEETITP